MSRDGPGCTFLFFRTASFQATKYEAWRKQKQIRFVLPTQLPECSRLYAWDFFFRRGDHDTVTYSDAVSASATFPSSHTHYTLHVTYTEVRTRKQWSLSFGSCDKINADFLTWTHICTFTIHFLASRSVLLPPKDSYLLGYDVVLIGHLFPTFQNHWNLEWKQ